RPSRSTPTRRTPSSPTTAPPTAKPPPKTAGSALSTGSRRTGLRKFVTWHAASGASPLIMPKACLRHRGRRRTISMLGLAGGEVVGGAALAGEAYRCDIGSRLRGRLLQLLLEAVVADRDRCQIEQRHQRQRAV